MAHRDSNIMDQDLDQLASLLRILSDKTRLNILLRLGTGERNVTDLCKELDLPQPTVSHHLGLLRMNNLVSSRRRGKKVFYMLNGRTRLTDDAGLEFKIEGFSATIHPQRH
jgi:DNA-binding transcriptional ArsR family regulator